MRAITVFLLLALAAGAAAQEGQVTELRPLDEPAAAAPETPEAPRSLEELPRKFVVQGKVKNLGGVGFVVLGDYYMIDELDPSMAALAWRHASSILGVPPFLGERLMLLPIWEDSWPRAADAFQCDLGRPLPHFQQVDWDLAADIPLSSDQAADLPAPPTILFRLALETLRRQPVLDGEEAARHFLEGRLLSLAGMDTAAMRSFLKVSTLGGAQPWSDQAAAQRGHLLYRAFSPERALAEYTSVQADDDGLDARVNRLREELYSVVPRADGDMRETRLRIIGRNVAARWVLEPPPGSLGRLADVTGPDGRPIHGTIHYRGEDFWVINLPLGTRTEGWERGASVTLRTYAMPPE